MRRLCIYPTEEGCINRIFFFNFIFFSFYPFSLIETNITWHFWGILQVITVSYLIIPVLRGVTICPFFIRFCWTTDSDRRPISDIFIKINIFNLNLIVWQVTLHCIHTQLLTRVDSNQPELIQIVFCMWTLPILVDSNQLGLIPTPLESRVEVGLVNLIICDHLENLIE